MAKMKAKTTPQPKSTPFPMVLWSAKTPAPPVADVLTQLGHFLDQLGYTRTFTALLKEAKEHGSELDIGGWEEGISRSTSVPLLELWANYYSENDCFPSASGEDSQDSPANNGKNASDSEDAASSDSESSDSSNDSSDEESSDDSDKETSAVPAGTKRKRVITPPASDSSEEDDSDDSSDSDDSTSSDAEDDVPPSKKQKTVASKVAAESSSEESSSSSEEDASDDSSDSSDDSDSESEDSDAQPTPSATASRRIEQKKDGVEKKTKKKAPLELQASSSDSSATLEGDTPDDAADNSHIHPDRLARVPGSTPASVPSTKKAAAIERKKQNIPFSRIPVDQAIDPRFASNEYVSYDYADRAHRDLIVTRGKGFTKEKNKKKRGAYRGGTIDLTPKGIKFDD